MVQLHSFTVSEAGVISKDRWLPHLQTQHSFREIEIHEKLLGPLDRGLTRGQCSNSAPRRSVVNKQNIQNVSFFHNFFENNEWMIHSFIFPRKKTNTRLNNL